MQLLGRAYVKYDGNLLKTKEGAKVNIGGVKRTAVVGNTVHGFSESVQVPFIECSISFDANTRLATLQAASDVTVTFECDTGQTYILRNAWLVDPPDLTGGSDGGAVPLRFEGESCEEMV